MNAMDYTIAIQHLTADVTYAVSVGIAVAILCLLADAIQKRVC